MAATACTQALETWFRSHGGYLHPKISIQEDSSRDVHYRATACIPPGTAIASAPHSLTLSYLNALIDDAFPVFKQQRHRFNVEALGFFYLMTQHLQRRNSFWKPYLDTLPSPDEEFTQPLFFDNAEDIAWLDGTDVWHTATARKKVYEACYRNGITVLKQGGVDVEPYTW